MKPFIAICLLCAGAVAGVAKEVSITLPSETTAFKPGAGVELAQANCITCHSVDYVVMQPPMPRKFWEANVKKMKEKFGAPIADDKVAALADYLTANYGVSDPAKK